jgi:hypothetical protein
MSHAMRTDRRNRRVPVDRCEVCCAVLGRRPQPHRRRCADHLAQLALVPMRAVGRRTRRAA